MNMAVEPAVFVPPLVVAHVLGFILLLYSLEKVSGVISKTFLRRRRSLPVDGTAVKRSRPLPASREGNEDPSINTLGGSPQHENQNGSSEARPMTDTVKEPLVLTAAWVRGCSCQVQHCAHCIALPVMQLPGT